MYIRPLEMKAKKSKILIVVGTRPNVIKVTQFQKISKQKFPQLEVKIVHTGQHYDYKMAAVFFEQFELKPNFYLTIDNRTPITQMSSIMMQLEELIENTYRPDLMIVPGDVNSTLAAAITANKLGIKLAHLESGLRSFDTSMPEEWNRILTDELSDYYFVTEQSGINHLKEENKKGKAYLVGNTMIDTMVAFENRISSSKILSRLEIKPDQFVLMTIHRPSNVDNKDGLLKLLKLLKFLDDKLKIVFPIHPRTEERIATFNLSDSFNSLNSLIRTEPMNYFDFQKLVAECKCVLTDSGGIQEETTFRQKPCLTLRNNTERPITTEVGSNKLVPFDTNIIMVELNNILKGDFKTGQSPPLWDGNSTERILSKIIKILS